ncbi:MAG: RDD family protein [Bacteroidetes bacterium]|nr:MAG: RDD family protein [Bacteroidota bacterium]
MSENLIINTTQNVRLNFELASLGDRILAGVIDILILWGAVLGFRLGLPQTIPIQITMYALVILYHPLFELFNNGRSIGKMVMKTRVIRLDGTEPTIGDYSLRWLLGLVEVLISQGSIAMISFLFGEKSQRLGDMAAGTTVAKLKPRVTLEQTLFEDTDDNYVPHYPQAGELSPIDIETLKEVVEAIKKTYTVSTITLIEKARSTVEAKLGIKAVEKDTLSFISRIIKDYNFISSKD